jgi:hypothetical protein
VRIPGLGRTWQAADGEWRPLTLGPEDDWSSVYPEEQPPSDGGGEDHDPLPERQPPASEDG